MRFKSIPNHVVQASKNYVLDLMGVTLFGSKTAHGEIIAEFVRQLGGKRESTVLAYGYRVPSCNAALANGVMAHGSDFDDGGIFHPGCAVTTSAIAAGESVQANGRDLIAAVVAGYDVSTRVALAVYPSQKKRGFHLTGTCNCFGAAAAAGKILGLEQEELVNAFGIAGTQAAGLTQYISNGETMLKHLHGGMAARNGVVAALLAKKGFTGSRNILEGAYGFCKVLSDEFDLSKLTEELGKRFDIIRTDLKPYPSCRFTHGPIDATLELVRTHRIAPDEVDKVTLKTFERYENMASLYDKPKPGTVLDAILSLQYAVALAFLEGNVAINHYTSEKIRDPKIRSFCEKIKIIVDPGLTEIYKKNNENEVSLITAHLKDGREFSYSIDYPKGSPSNPLTRNELIEKFRALALMVLPEKKTKEVIEVIDSLEKLEDVRKLTHLLKKSNHCSLVI